jgi:hypothetical protein
MMLKILPKNVVAVLVKVEEQANRKNLRTEQDIELNAPLHRAKSELICPYSPIAFDQIKEPPASSRKQISDYVRIFTYRKLVRVAPPSSYRC